MKTIYKRRLLKLMRHLRTGKLGHDRFDFGQYNNAVAPKCGTAGCAIGECPVIWKSWIFTNSGDPVIKGDACSLNSGQEWFGINAGEYRHLFMPDRQSLNLYGGKSLSRFATRRQVAANIEAFIKVKRYNLDA